MSKIDCALRQDRDMLTVILARNGYTVRQGKERRGSSRSCTCFVEYGREQDERVFSPGEPREEKRP